MGVGGMPSISTVSAYRRIGVVERHRSPRAGVRLGSIARLCGMRDEDVRDARTSGLSERVRDAIVVDIRMKERGKDHVYNGKIANTEAQSFEQSYIHSQVRKHGEVRKPR